MNAAGSIDEVAVVEPGIAVRLVLGVARLGEADLAGWWSSQGLNPAVTHALAILRRTGVVVGAELALLSARRRHAQLLPRASAIQLFSPHLPFPGWAHAHLAELKSIGADDLVDQLRLWTTVELATAGLRAWRSAVGAASDGTETITAAQLADSAVTFGLLGRFVDGYLAQVGQRELRIPYVDVVV